ncbi:efflux RND transporter periplasmic adaptor subunit [Clostridium sp. Marseille-P2415]|uniref:efflux RND transporter periplasmic adaptor subunit n=1 Tax=Clostridium sp. Marseille-P2415 TaxID=1805471 RepID=UPI0009885C8C|nr:efflux RND transporter periplasmic adaptor subunit [Clostridium sp. Marseille-P2415]
MRKGYLIVMLTITVLLAGCSDTNAALKEQKTVNATSVNVMEYETGLDYLGIIRAKETKNYSFLSGGKLEAVYIKAGEEVNAGAPLAKLDTFDLEINVNKARANVNGLKKSLDTAKSALDASAALHSSGYIADKEWEAQESQYVTLAGNYEVALDNLKQAEKNLKDSVLYADADGYVMEVPYKEGEVVAAGYPVAVMKSSRKVVSIGVSTDDISKVTLTSAVKIDGRLDARIDSIGQYPDEKTRAYIVDVVFNSDEYAIGDMVHVQVNTGKTNGCFVPVQSIFNIDGLDYVYVVDESGLVSRKQIIRCELREDMVQVEGLEEGMTVVSDGVKNVKEQDIVVVASPSTAAGKTAGTGSRQDEGNRS